MKNLHFFLCGFYPVNKTVNDVVVFNRFDKMKNILKKLLIKLRAKIFFVSLCLRIGLYS